MLSSILFIGNERIHLTFLTLSAIHTSRETNKYTQTIFYGGLFFLLLLLLWFCFLLVIFYLVLLFIFWQIRFLCVSLLLSSVCVFFFLLLSTNGNGTEFVSNFIGFNFISPKQVPTKKKSSKFCILYALTHVPTIQIVSLKLNLFLPLSIWT